MGGMLSLINQFTLSYLLYRRNAILKKTVQARAAFACAGGSEAGREFVVRNFGGNWVKFRRNPFQLRTTVMVRPVMPIGANGTGAPRNQEPKPWMRSVGPGDTIKARHGSARKKSDAKRIRAIAKGLTRCSDCS